MEEEKKKGYHPLIFYLFVFAGAFVVGIVIFNFIVLPLLVGRGDIAIVPEVKGMLLSPAEEACKEKELNLMVTGERYSIEFPAGTVIEQDPGSGESLKGNRTVKVIISSGPRLETVPEVDGESIRQAELMLEASGLRKGRIVRIFSNEGGPNRVISASPPVGSLAPTGSGIEMLLSMTGEPRVYMMPDLRGKDLLFVKDRLESCGFHVSRVVSRKDMDMFPNTILSQNPDPGQAIKEGGTIELVVSTVD
ncbi:MAG: PASTA domain-containing protein [Candidatus Krumholzibacteria bacterium]|nr:PASTA domain-containing protein [Candidatus Krumholzibacteria bacterium]